MTLYIRGKRCRNVDCYSGVIYEALEFPTGIFTLLFAISRTASRRAKWLETVTDEQTGIARARQMYVGPEKRDFIPLEERE